MELIGKTVTIYDQSLYFRCIEPVSFTEPSSSAHDMLQVIIIQVLPP